MGPFVPRFEQAFADFVGVSQAFACVNGTAALHLALLAAGVEAGDEVWVSDLTFIASANPALYCGASVTFVDSERESWNLDPDLVVEELSRRVAAGEQLPAAIIPVHMVGHPAQMSALLDACKEHGVIVIEDAAEALGATWTEGPLVGRAVGTVGEIGTYSFNGNKIITTGGGGMLVSQRPDWLARMRHLANQAREPGPFYVHDEIGFNYRLSNLTAALGVAQMESLPEHLERKRAIAARYDASFSAADGIEPPPDCGWATRTAWMYTALFDDTETRDRVHTALEAEGIESRPLWVPLHVQAPYVGAPVLGGGKVSEDIASRALCLPCSVRLTADEQDEVIGYVMSSIR
jgi:dTDP-4-amino-4,6-dideoxygalactose transaminase